MQKQNSRYCYTPSDLVEFFASPFASWMSRLSLDSPDHVQPDPDAPQLVTLAKQGQQHEQTVLAQLQAEGRDVYTVPPVGDLPPFARMTTSTTTAPSRPRSSLRCSTLIPTFHLHPSWVGTMDAGRRTPLPGYTPATISAALP